MSLPDSQISFILIFFIYGLAFFSMGLAMWMESRRTPLLADAGALRPLALFGFLHGIHEWLDLALLVKLFSSSPFQDFVVWIRLGLLILSFTFLIHFSLRVLRPHQKGISPNDILSGVILFGLFLTLLFLTSWSDKSTVTSWLQHTDALARYFLAVPGAALAALALNRQSVQARAENRGALVKPLLVAAVGFGIYSLTQFFVTPTDIFPARYVNSQTFLALTGIPVQAVRATLAVLIMVGLIRASDVAQDERDLQLLAAQAARLEALEQVQRELVEREAMRRELLRHTVIAQEDERGRIARELHDETAQFLTALRLNLATLKGSVTKKSDTTHLIDRLDSLSRQMSQGIYRMVHDLRPAQLDDLGLVAALQYLAEEQHCRTGLEVTLQIEGRRQRLDPLVETVFFRVAQEALTNIARHAHYGYALLLLKFSPDQIILRVTDEGVGFDINQRLSPPHGWGLAGMRERAESVSGKLRIQSVPGQGTQVELMIPLSLPDLPKLEDAAYEYHPFDAGR